MINFEAFFKVSYGLYIVASGDKKYGNGYISNTVFQVTSTPARFATCCNKDNHTSGLIEKHNKFSVSVLHQETDPKIYGKFGYQSGKNIEKLNGMDVHYASTGVPIILNDAIAFLECTVSQKVDLDTHWLFIGNVVSAEVLDQQKEALTYAYYRDVKKGIAPKNAPTYVDKATIEVKKETS
jgi:flavin reductase (DIM6/NTAB) family NADH-FMN oxidoreductase RutF